MEHWTAGDYGGAFAGAVAGLAAIGKSLAWLLNWQGARENRRSQRLAEWETSLNKREREYRLELEGKFDAIECEVRTLRGRSTALAVTMIDVTADLRAVRPESPALARAAATLRIAFPIEDGIPPEMAALLAQLNEKGVAHGNGNA
jgi:hypothetical protein